MKRHHLLTIALSAALFAFAAPPVVDKEKHSVTFDVVSTDCGIDTKLEFFLVGAESDHDYEAMFMTENSAAELAEAFEKAGFPRGTPSNPRECRFWPTGGAVTFEPGLWTFVTDTLEENSPAALYTGGARDESGLPEAATNMPQAVFALYDCPQSLFQLDDSLSQTETYGRFRPAVKIPRGEKRRITATWNGIALHEKLNLVLEPGGIPNALAMLRAKSECGKELDVTAYFSPAMTVAEAKICAAAFQTIDSPRVKFNGYADGQFYYRAFLPLERWRDRRERLVQPYEVRIGEDGKPSLTIVKEDWTSNPDSTDPVLEVRENVAFAETAKPGDQTDSCLIFASAQTRLADVFAVRALLPRRVVNYYIYGD